MMRTPLVSDPGLIRPGVAREEDYDSPEDRSWFFGRYIFLWVWPCISKANREGGMLEEDMPNLPQNDRPHRLMSALAEKVEGVKTGIQLFKVLGKIQPRIWLMCLFNVWMFLFCMAIDPYLLSWLLSEISEGKSYDFPWYYPRSPMFIVLLLALSMFTRVACMEVGFFSSVRCSNNMRTALVNAIFAVVMDDKATKRTVGQWTNLMCTDADTLGKASATVWTLGQWSFSVIYFPVVFYSLWELVGNGVFGSFAVGVLTYSTTRYLSKRMQAYNKRLQELRDVRSQRLNLVINSMRTCKLYAKEEFWKNKLMDARQQELYQLRRNLWMRALLNATNVVLNAFVPLSVFGSYVYLEEKELDATTCFTALAFLQNITWSLNTLPYIVDLYTMLNPSLTRLKNVLCGATAADTLRAACLEGNFTDSQATNPMQHMLVTDTNPLVAVDMTASATIERGSICLRNATLGYTPVRAEVIEVSNVDESGSNSGTANASETELETAEPLTPVPILKIDELRVRCGELVIIAGHVGIGKTTLLESLSGSLNVLEGNLSVVGRRAFVSQVPFLMNSTLQENILFGLPMDKTKYDRVIAQSMLEPDFDMLPDKDLSKVGESGVQLSGGQRSRVGFARALYADADVYFFDDVLSAVDAHTGKKLWETITTLVKQARTVLMVTHQVQYISRPEVSKVLIVDEGTIKHDSTWEELSSRKDIPIMQYVKEWSIQAERTDESVEFADSDGGSDVSAQFFVDAHGVTPLECKNRVAEVLATMEGRVVDQQLIAEAAHRVITEEAEERRRVGVIPWADFKVYLSAFGRWYTLVFLLIAVCSSAGISVASNVWLSIWTSKETQEAHLHPQSWYMKIFFYIAVATAIVGLFQSICLLLCSLRASTLMHNWMLSAWFRAPMKFFDSTPTGGHLNRFMQDISSIDQMVPQVCLSTITCTLNICTQMGVIIFSAPYVLLSIPFLMGPYTFVFQKVRAPSRDSRRFEAVAHTPIYSCFVDTLRGRNTIRAFGAEARFSQMFRKLSTSMARAKYGNEAINKWAQSLVTMTGCFLYFAAGIACVKEASRGRMEASTVGTNDFPTIQIQS